MNLKQIPINESQIPNKNLFGHWDLVLGISLMTPGLLILILRRVRV